MKIVYKKIKLPVEHCGVCGERLQGDNSIAFPYKCSCGTWESNLRNPSEFKLKKK